MSNLNIDNQSLDTQYFGLIGKYLKFTCRGPTIGHLTGAVLAIAI